MEKGLALTYGFRSDSVPLWREHGRAEVLATRKQRKDAIFLLLPLVPPRLSHTFRVGLPQ